MISAGSTRARTTGGTVPHRATPSPRTAQTPATRAGSRRAKAERSPGRRSLQSLVAQASATAGSGAKTVTASATPNETDGPTVADEVQQPRTPSPGGEDERVPVRVRRAAGVDADPEGPVGRVRDVPAVLDHAEARARSDHGLDAGRGDGAGHGGHGPDAGLVRGPDHAENDRAGLARVVRLERGEEEGVAGGHALDLAPGREDRGLRGGEVGLLLREEGGVGLAEVEPLAEHQSWSESAPCGQASWHLPQRTQRPSSTTSCQSGSNAKTSCGQIEMQAPQSTHSSRS